MLCCVCTTLIYLPDHPLSGSVIVECVAIWKSLLCCAQNICSNMRGNELELETSHSCCGLCCCDVYFWCGACQDMTYRSVQGPQRCHCQDVGLTQRHNSAFSSTPPLPVLDFYLLLGFQLGKQYKTLWPCTDYTHPMRML